MSNGPQYCCWHCYTQSVTSSGPCAACGRLVEGPSDADYQDQVVWALRHPLPDRRLIAVTVLAELGGDRAASRLRELVYGQDPYLAAAALRAFTGIVGLRSRGLLIQAAATGPAPVRRTARELLAQRDDPCERHDRRSA